jgi:molybdenum cofactor synthesis domain-containing protein
VIELAEAREHVLARVGPLAPRRVAVAEADGCVVAAPVVAAEAVPPFANSAVDGFAVRAADVATVPVELPVVATLPAGGDPAGISVAAGQAVRIVTGAPMPEGADAVVMIEDTSIVDASDAVRIGASVRAGQHVRPAGDDLVAGDVVLAPGTVLTAAHVGVLASLGVLEVEVVPRPRVGVLSTGDELVTGPGPLRPGQIRDSNRQALAVLLRASGCEAVDLGLVRDDEAAITTAIEEACDTCDALLTSGGVSMGDFDYVKAVLDRIADMRWMQIAIKPAKPFAFGTVERGDRRIPVFGLPGNPVSSLVSYELLARPALRRMQGRADDDLERLRVRAVADDGLPRRADGKVHVLRSFVSYHQADGRFHVSAGGAQGSHQLSSQAATNGLAVLADGDGVAPGGEVEVLLVGEPRSLPS